MATNLSNPFTEFFARYKHDPVLFATEVLGITPDKWQADALRAYAKGHRRLSIRSGHGVGKSTFLGFVVWHHAIFNADQKTVVTAPTTAQLFDALWAEIKRMYSLLPEALQSLWDVKSDRIELLANPAGNFIAARTSRAETPEAMQGVHSAGSVLLIGDEASGIPEPIFEAAAGSMSGHNARTLLCGNPVRTSGFFFDTHNKLRDMWWTLRVSCEDSKFVSPDYVSDMERRYGGRESNAFRVRVLGEFPLADAETVIPFEWVESAKTRDIRVPADVPVVWGLDVARTGNDRTALCKRKGFVVLDKVAWWREPDLMATVGRVKRMYDECSHDDKPVAIMVDAVGLGAGVADRLRELGLPARAINVSESAGLNDKYRNLRAELWFKAREWFEGKSVRIPADDPTLTEELVAVKFKITSSGKYQIESKEEMKRSGRASPDLADAFVLTFASNAANAAFGSRGASSWATPIRRKGGVGYA